MNDDAFFSLLGMLMEADPWPYSVNRDPIEELLDAESRSRGYSDWIEALHFFDPGLPIPGEQVTDGLQGLSGLKGMAA